MPVKPRAELVELMERFAKQDGTHETAIPALHFFRASRISEPLYSVYEPSICIVAQGSKVVLLGQERYEYDPNSYLTTSVHLPVTGRVVEASQEDPYLCLQLTFNMNQILTVLQASEQTVGANREAGRSLAISRMNDTLYDAVLRLVKLLEAPQDIPVLAPYAIHEIIYRVLRDEHNAALKQFALIGSHSQRIAKAIERLNRNFASPLQVDELAKEASMSPSSFYHYFKEVTGMSPIQYQKRIRLQEARQLLLTERIDAAEAAFRVGYESPSYFNREYAHMFGLPPIKDVRRFHDALLTGEALQPTSFPAIL